MARLIIYEEKDGKDTVFEIFNLLSSRILIGSSEDSDLVLDASEVDPGHASLELRQDHWVLQDLGGPGGTVVNDISITGPHYLQDHDLIEIGYIRMRFQESDTDVDGEDNEEDEDEEETEVNEEPAVTDPHIRGRVWFAAIAGATIATIFIILLLLIVADYLGLFQISDLLPPWF